MKKQLITTAIFFIIYFIYYSSGWYVTVAHSSVFMLSHAESITWQGIAVLAGARFLPVALWLVLHEAVKIFYLVKK